MRIISQERDYSFDFSTKAIMVYKTKIIAVDDITCPYNTTIGIYDTEERAKEVFEDIHKAYAPIYSISNGLTEEQVKNAYIGSENVKANNVITKSNDYYITTYDNYIYYMPKE